MAYLFFARPAPLLPREPASRQLRLTHIY